MGQLLRDHVGFVVLSHSWNGMMGRKMGLYDNLTAGPCRIGETDRVEKHMIGTFGGSEIRYAEPCVCLHNSNEAHRRERPST
jgi:hypothetical protein